MVMEGVPIPVSIQGEATTVNVLRILLFYLTIITVLKVIITFNILDILYQHLHVHAYI